MKKYLLLPVALFTLGCVNNAELQKQASDKKINKQVAVVTKDMKLLKKYHTTKLNLHKFGNDFIFLNLNSNGSLTFYKIDKNYDLISSKLLKKFVISDIKVQVQNDKIYILGYSQTENKPIFVVLDKNGNVLKQFLVGKKFNTPKDFIIQGKDIIVLLNIYSKENNSDIAIYKNDKLHLFSSKFAEEAHSIRPYKNGYLLSGNVSRDTQDIFVAYLDKNFKPIWIRDIDFGLEESIKSIKIENNEIILSIISQNYTGMEQYYTIKIDKNGKILNQSKLFEIKNYPIRFQG